MSICRSILMILFLCTLFVPDILFAADKVTFAVFPRGWPPFEMVVDGKPEGVAVELFRKLMPDGIEPVVDLVPAPRSVLHAHGAPVYARLECRDWWTRDLDGYLWSAPVMESKTVLYSSASTPVVFTGAESLYGLRVGCIRNYVYPELQPLFDSGKAERYDVNEDLLLLRMLKAGRVDVAVFDEMSAAWMIRNAEDMEKKDFHVVEKPLSVAVLRFVFNLDSGLKRRLPAIDERIRAKREDGTIDRILARYR